MTKNILIVNIVYNAKKERKKKTEMNKIGKSFSTLGSYSYAFHS